VGTVGSTTGVGVGVGGELSEPQAESVAMRAACVTMRDFMPRDYVSSLNSSQVVVNARAGVREANRECIQLCGDGRVALEAVVAIERER
jgi:hypothetical protein